MSRDIAIIGMACRIPGASNRKELWNLLSGHKDLVVEFPENRREDIERLNTTAQQKCHDVPCRLGGFLPHIDEFDAEYFGLSTVQAASMDPSHRLFLEVAREALEDALCTKQSLNGSSTGVFIGFSPNEDLFLSFLDHPDPQQLVENQPAMMPYRLSYSLNLKGPTCVIDTSCSSSLAALHQACRALQAGDCTQAIVAGVNLHFFPALRDIENLGLEAFDGRCKTFDARADGTNIGEGVIVCVLKLHDLAQRDHDPVHLTICSSSINSDGRSNGLTAPHPQAQADVIVSAWKDADITPEELSFIETHGTGTKLGDPIEIYALSKACSSFAPPKKKIPLGALKTNIGHLEAAAGLASILKTAVCLAQRKLPRNLHYTSPNPLIDWNGAPITPADQDIDFSGEEPLYAAISSFGLTGTNVHVVVRGPDNPLVVETTPIDMPPLLLSAPSLPQLHALLARYSEFLEQKTPPLYDIAWTAATHRERHTVRLGILGRWSHTIQEILSAWKDPTTPPPHHHHAVSSNAQITGNEKIHKCLRQFFSNQPFSFEEWYPTGKKQFLPTTPHLPVRCWPQLLVEKQRHEELPDVSFTLQWQENFEPYASNFEGPYLVFADPSHRKHQEVLSHLRSKNISFLPVFFGDLFAISDQQVTIRPSVEEDYVGLLKAAKERWGRSWKGILHLWTCWQPYAATSVDDASISCDLGAISLVHISHALETIAHKESINLIAVASQVHTITGRETAYPPLASLEGICKVLSQENPFVTSLFIDTDEETPLEAIFGACGAITPLGEATIAFRAGRRYTSLIAPLDITSLKPRQRAPHAGGHYLIAGGLGYLGLKTARLLAEQFPVNLTIVGRSDGSFLDAPLHPDTLSPKAIKQYEAVAALRRLGADVIYLQADVSNGEGCRNMLEAAVARHGKVDGVFLAIKNISHTRLKTLSASVCRANIMAKISSTLHLANMLPDLDFFALFSSISSLTGGPTGADCCASNLFLDAYVESRGQERTISMNFTLIAADDASLQADRLSMIPPLSQDLFLKSLQLFVNKELPFGVIARFSPRVLRLVLPLMKVRFSHELLKKLSPAAATREVAQKPLPVTTSDAKDRAEEIVSVWEETLGRPCRDRTVHFFQAGGDSILAARLTQRLRSRLALTVDIADLYAHPRLDAFITRVLPAGQEPATTESIDDILDLVAAGKIDIDQACSTIKGTYA